MGVRDDGAGELAEVGRRFRIARAALGVAQSEAARSVGVSPSELSLIERGRRSCGAVVARDLARLYGVSLDWVYGLRQDGGPALLPPTAGISG